MKRGLCFVLLIAFVFLIGFVSAGSINDTLHLNIQTTNSSGIATGTFKFEFNITTDSSCNNVVYNNYSSLTTDSRGIVSHYLDNVNLNFSDQYWLCYYRDGTLINASRIVRVPYAFDAKNVSASGIINDSNMDLTGKNITAAYFFGDGSHLTGVAGSGDFSFSDFSASFILNSSIINNTKNIQILLNDTGVYSTYNATYDNYADNVSRNYTQDTFDAYNDTWDNSWVNGFSDFWYNHTSSVFGLWGMWFYNQTTPAIDFMSESFQSSFVSNSSIINNTKNIQELINGTSLSLGDTDFNDGWTSGGASIVEGSIFAQTIYVYNISSLTIDNIHANGSFIPAFDGQFTLGNSTYRWDNIFVSGDIHSNGTILINDGIDVVLLNDTLLILSVNSTKNIQELLNSTGVYSIPLTINSTKNIQELINGTNMNFESLGIGISLPQAILHVIGGGLFNLTGAQDFSIINETGTSLFYVNGSNGWVGIGTNTPSNTLDVRGQGNFSGTIYINNGTDVSTLGGGGLGNVSNYYRVYDTGWINTNDWTNQQLGTTAGGNVVHNLNAPLSNLSVKVLISADGTDANSFEMTVGNDVVGKGLEIFDVDNNNLIVQTGVDGLYAIDSDGNTFTIDTENWYYKVVVTNVVAVNSTDMFGLVPEGAVMQFNLDSCPVGWIATDGTGGTPDLTPSEYDTGWINTNDWTHRELGSNATDSNVAHNLNAPLSNLSVKVYISSDGTDANSIMIEGNDWNGFGYTVYHVDANSIKIETPGNGLLIIDDSGSFVAIDTEDWYYKIVVKKAYSNGLIYCQKTAEDTSESNSIWASDEENVTLNNASKKLVIQNDTTIEGKLNVSKDLWVNGVNITGSGGGGGTPIFVNDSYETYFNNSYYPDFLNISNLLFVNGTADSVQVFGRILQVTGLSIINQIVHTGRKEIFAGNNAFGQGAPVKNTWMVPEMTNYSAGYGNAAFFGGVFDGESLWMIPNYADYLVKVNPATGEMTNYSSGYNGGSDAFRGGVFDGESIWMIPSSSKYLAKVDPSDGTMTNYSADYGSISFGGGVFDGESIWMIPLNSGYLAKVDPSDGTMTNYTNGYNGGFNSFGGGVFDGENIWMIPYTSKYLAKVDPSDGTMTNYSADYGSAAFRGGVFDGESLWMIPYYATYLVKVNPATGEMTNYSADYNGGNAAFSGGVFDGESLWMIPQGSEYLVKVDPSDGTMTNYSSGVSFGGGVFDGENIWMIDYGLDSLTKVRPQEFGRESLFTAGNLNVGANATIAGSLNVGKELWVNGVNITGDASAYYRVYDTGWINTNDWTNQQLGTTVGGNVVHNFNVPLSNLSVKVLVSTDGTDANSFEIMYGDHSSDNKGITIFEVDSNNIIVQTGSTGLTYVQLGGGVDAIDTENWYYKVVVTNVVAVNSTDVFGLVPAGAVMQFNLDSCPVGWIATDGTGGTPDLTPSEYDTGWVSNSDWGNQQLGTTAGGNVVHNLNAPLSNLSVNVLVSSDGTDANSFEIQSYSGAPSGNELGITISNIDNNNIKVQTGTNGVTYLIEDAGYYIIDSENWYYKIVVKKAYSNGLIYCQKTTEDTSESNSIWTTSGENVTLNNQSKNVSLRNNTILDMYTIDSAALAVNEIQTLPHGLGQVPNRVQASLLCISAELGYAVGDEIFVPVQGYSVGREWSLSADATNFYVQTDEILAVLRRDSPGATTVVTMNKWKIRIRYGL